MPVCAWCNCAGVPESEQPLATNSEWDPELEEAVRKEKEELVNESMLKLEAGMNESKVIYYVCSTLHRNY